MKVVFVGTRGIPNILGGVETHCEELCPRLVQLGVEVIVVRRSSYASDSLSTYKGVTLKDISAPKSKSFEAIIHTFKAICWARFCAHADILHIHAIGPALLVPFARLLGLKVVFTHHGPDYDRQKWGRLAKLILKLGEYGGARYAHKVISISEVISKILADKYHRTDVDLIYNGVPAPHMTYDEAYLSSLGLQPGKYMLAMGRFVPEKNFDDLIHAFQQMDHAGYKLVLAGDNTIEDPYSKSLKAFAKEQRVVLTGFIKGHPLSTLLTSARGFVLPSSHEGLPISLLEAMSYHLPVLVSDIPANKAVKLPDECYFKVKDVEQLAGKLAQLLSQFPQPVSYDMGCYDWNYIARQVYNLYQRVLSK